LVECYWLGVDEAALREAAVRAQHAAAELTADGQPVSLRAAWLFPKDEVAFLVYAGTAAAVYKVNGLAGVRFERLAELIEIELPPQPA
jgi:hypothetical protein